VYAVCTFKDFPRAVIDCKDAGIAQLTEVCIGHAIAQLRLHSHVAE